MLANFSQNKNRIDAKIWTEGKTDWKHLKKALAVLQVPLNISFEEYEISMGDNRLLEKCENVADIFQETPVIFIFDRDNHEIIKKVTDPTKPYKAWGNNVFSFTIPNPDHRINHENLCIELYYKDAEIQTKDIAGRRLYLSSEFNEVSGKHNTLPSLNVGIKKRIEGLTTPTRATVLDMEVYDETNQTIAISKAAFAENVYNAISPFNTFNFEPFKKIFTIIELIIQSCQKKFDVFFPDMEYINKHLLSLPYPQGFSCILEMMLSISKFVSMLLIAYSVRHFEELIIKGDSSIFKKIRPLNKIIEEGFREPSLAILHKFARTCHYLLSNEHTPDLLVLRDCLDERIALGPIGDLFDQLEVIFPPDLKRGRSINKSNLRKSALDYIFPELGKYESKISILQEILENRALIQQSDLNVWYEALTRLTALFANFSSLSLLSQQLVRIDTNTDDYIVSVQKYQQGYKKESEEIRKFQDLTSPQLESCELLLNNSDPYYSLNLFPFFIIRHDKLAYYKRTRAIGYEYRDSIGQQAYVVHTKRKFSQYAFKKSDTGVYQELFWTGVTQSKSDKNGVTANIPSENLQDFVGRERQKSKIIDEIIQIPNQNDSFLA
jgi:hypothetical protein